MPIVTEKKRSRLPWWGWSLPLAFVLVPAVPVALMPVTGWTIQTDHLTVYGRTSVMRNKSYGIQSSSYYRAIHVWAGDWWWRIE